MLSKLTDYLILVFLFLLPWQARWIYGTAKLNGLPWEYGTLSFYGTEFFLWLVVILTGIRIFAKKDFWQRIASRENFSKRWPYLLIGLFLAAVTTYFYVSSPLASVGEQFISRLLGAVCLMICLPLSEVDWKKASLMIWLAGVGQGILAMIQFLTQNVFACKWLGMASHSASDTGAAVVQFGAERWLRAYGSFGWPNSLGIFLAVVLLVGAILFSRAGKKFWPFLIAGQMIVFVGLFFTFSRGAWLAAFVGLIVYFLVNRTDKFACLILVKQILAFVLILAVLLPAYFPILAARFSADEYLEQLSLNERFNQYQIAEKVITAHPFLGVGPGLYTYYLAENFIPPAYGLYQPVHNIFILALAELGVFVFLALAVFLVWILKRIWQTNKIYLSVVAVLLIAGLFDHFLWSLYGGQILFWAVLGMGLAQKGEVK